MKNYIVNGTIFLILIIIIIVYVIRYLIWCKNHKRPLTNDEIMRLRIKRIKNEIYRVNHCVRYFSKRSFIKNTDLKSDGSFIPCNIESKVFPSYISSQLHGKKHEWLVIGFVKEGIVISFWANKGEKTFVCPSIPFNEVVNYCLKNNCTALLELHNHPNPNSSKYNMLSPSKADKNSSKWFFDNINKFGISLFSFVCERGNWIKYYQEYTNYLQLEPEFTKFDYIQKQNGISEEQNLKLHKELGLFHK